MANDTPAPADAHRPRQALGQFDHGVGLHEGKSLYVFSMRGVRTPFLTYLCGVQVAQAPPKRKITTETA